jgi:hypothetical protein
LDGAAEVLSTAELCRTLSRFSRIAFFGDSLTRQLYVALLVAMRGGTTSADVLWGDAVPAEKRKVCVAAAERDGLLPESCRHLIARSLKGHRAQKLGMCTMLPEGTALPDVFLVETWLASQALEFRQCVPTTRGQLAIIGGGLHFGLKGYRFTSEMLEPIISMTAAQLRGQVVYAGVHGTGARKPVKYAAEQNTDKTVAFFANITTYLHESGARSVDFFPLVVTAERTCTRRSLLPDGTHANLQLNLAKVQWLVQLLAGAVADLT